MGDFGNTYEELDQMDVDQAVREVLSGVLGENVFSLRKVSPLFRYCSAERQFPGEWQRVN